MNKIIQSGLFALALFVFGSSARAADQPFKIATVDLSKAFDSYYKTVQASIASSNAFVNFEKERNEMVLEARKREADWRDAVDKANRMDVAADERARFKKAADDIAFDLQVRSENISNYSVGFEAQHRDQTIQHVKDLTTEINGVLEAIAKKKGYSMVLDKTAKAMTGNPVVLWTSGENDLTDALIKELNSTAPATPPSETNGPAGKSPPDKPLPK